ncbi:hypothetical protein [Actinophytocola sediminis]
MRSRDRLIRQALRERFVITLHSGEAVEGLLWAVDDHTVILADAASLSPLGQRTPIDGWVYLPRTGVAYLQRPQPPPPTLTPRGR